MPKAFPMEFREDVIRVYKSSDASMAQVAKDFGISPSCLKRWLAIDDQFWMSMERSTAPKSASHASSPCGAPLMPIRNISGPRGTSHNRVITAKLSPA